MGLIYRINIYFSNIEIMSETYINELEDSWLRNEINEERDNREDREENECAANLRVV